MSHVYIARTDSTQRLDLMNNVYLYYARVNALFYIYVARTDFNTELNSLRSVDYYKEIEIDGGFKNALTSV